jgi:CBS domain-containing protein
MERDRSVSGFCVTEDCYLAGVITRSELYRFLSGQYGYNLYAKKPIEKIMRKEFLRVDHHESIEIVAKKAMSRDIEHLYDFITVTQDGRYFGIVTVKDLLEKSLQVEVNHAKHINPLSELPGNALIERKLKPVSDAVGMQDPVF